MIRKENDRQNGLEFVSIENLVPEDHFLRKVDRYIDFGFIREKCLPFYCPDNGRPAIDPVRLFKILFLGYFFGVRSERQLIRDIQVNLAYRWFLGMGIAEKPISHSTLSQNRCRRFQDSPVYQEIFDEIVFQAMNHNLVGGEQLFTDSTHIRANANRNRFTKEVVRKQTRDYLGELDRAVNEDRIAHGKKPLDPKPPKPEKNEQEKEERKAKEPETKVSSTDPESGYLSRPGKPEGFAYLDHRTVDGKANIITDVHLTPGNVNDCVPYLERLDAQIAKFGFNVREVALDAGYNTIGICHGLVERGLFGVVGYRKPSGRKRNGEFYLREYCYDRENDCYICPCGHRLTYSTTTRDGNREYVSTSSVCRVCPQLHRCMHNKTGIRKISRHVWEDDREQLKRNRNTLEGKRLYHRRQETIERSFADAKVLHGYRYARFRGLRKVLSQGLLTAACQNMKKIVTLLERCRKNPEAAPNQMGLLAKMRRLLSCFPRVWRILPEFRGRLPKSTLLSRIILFPKCAMVGS
jgi:transposase/IS5 family transposase